VKNLISQIVKSDQKIKTNTIMQGGDLKVDST